MNAPPAVCRRCGWLGSPSWIDATNSVGTTFRGVLIECPRCGGPADVGDGTYDFVHGVVQRVRDAALTLADIRQLRSDLDAARQAQQTSEAFASAHPQLAPVIKYIVQQPGPKRDWLMILLMVLALVVPFIQSDEHHADERLAAPPTPTTLVLDDSALEAICQKVEVGLLPKPKPSKKAPARRPPKQHGRNKP